MNCKLVGGQKEEGIIVGNLYDKYGSSNPIIKWLMGGFESALSEFVAKASPGSIHEVGCGEGYWVTRWKKQGLSARGSDFSQKCIELARENATRQELPTSLFEQCNIYDLDADRHSADLVVCSEVLEHLEDPEAGLQALQRIVRQHIILSVPREPIWCLMNLARGKYVTKGGNTPGHINHWSKKSFLDLVSKYFDIVETRCPLPWTIVRCTSHC